MDDGMITALRDLRCMGDGERWLILCARESIIAMFGNMIDLVYSKPPVFFA